jgi:hypothetical protein
MVHVGRAVLEKQLRSGKLMKMLIPLASDLAAAQQLQVMTIHNACLPAKKTMGWSSGHLRGLGPIASSAPAGGCYLSDLIEIVLRTKRQLCSASNYNASYLIWGC